MQKEKYDQFFTVCPKQFFLILFFCLSLFLQTAQAAEMLVPVGKTVGVTMDTQGLLVLGTGSVDGENGRSNTP